MTFKTGGVVLPVSAELLDDAAFFLPDDQRAVSHLRRGQSFELDGRTIWNPAPLNPADVAEGVRAVPWDDGNPFVEDDYCSECGRGS